MKLKLGGRALGVSHDDKADRKTRRVEGRRRYVVPDAEEARKKVEEMGEGQLVKMKDGDNHMLILSTTVDMQLGHTHPWIETFNHFCGGNSVLGALGIRKRPDDFPLVHACLKAHFNKRCGWCDYRDELLRRKNKRDRELGGALYPNPNYHSNIVVIGKEHIVRQLRFPKKVALQLLAYIEEGVFFSDPEDLIVVNIKRTKTGSDIRNVEYNAIVNQRRSKGPIKEEWDDQLVDLNKFMPTVPTNAEIDVAIDNLETLAEVGAEISSDVGSDMSDYVGKGRPSGRDNVGF